MSNASSKPALTQQPAAEPHGKGRLGVTWGPAAAILITAASMAGAYVAAAIAANMLAYFAPGLFGWDGKQLQDWLTSVQGQFLLIVIAEAIIVAIVIWFLRRRKTSVRALGFYRKPQLSDAGYVLVTFGLYFVVVAVVTSLAKAVFHIDLEQKQELGFDSVISNSDKLLTFISLVLIPPVVEEFLFRGFMFSGLRTKLPFIWATVITSVLFASLHLAEGAGSVLWVAGIDTFILSVFLCILRERTGNLWAGILLHALKNGIAFTYLYIFVAR